MDFEKFGLADYLVVCAYFLFVIVFGFYSNILYKHRTREFLTTWLPIGSTIFTANMGGEYLIGLPGSASVSGIGVFAFELNSLIILQLCSWLFLPVFLSSKASTLPAYMTKRFGGSRIRIYLSMISLLLYVFTKISVNLFAGAFLMQQTLSWNIYISICFLLVLTFLCIVTECLTFFAQVFQTLMMLLTSGVVLSFSLSHVGGIRALFDRYLLAIPSNFDNKFNLSTIEPFERNFRCTLPTENDFLLLRSLGDKNIPWAGFLFGQTVVSIWFWCTDQTVVRRMLISESLSHSQASTIFAGLLKILPFFLIIVPGMASRILFPDQVACVESEACFKFCANSISCANSAFPKLISGIIPSPLKGLIVATFFGSLVFDLASVFQTSGQLLVDDVLCLFRSRVGCRGLVLVRRIIILFMTVIGVAWVPIVERIDSGMLYFYIQDVLSTFVPSISAIFILAITVRNVTERAAFYSLVCGLFIGLGRMALILSYPDVQCDEPEVRPWFIRLHFMYFAVLLFCITIGTCLGITVYDEPLSEEFLIRTTYKERHSTVLRVDETMDQLNSSIHEMQSNVPPWMDATPRRFSLSYQCLKTLFSPFYWLESLKSWLLIENVNLEEFKHFDDRKNRLEQNLFIKVILLILMLSIVLTSIGLFIFLSTNSWWKVVFL